MSKSMSEVVSQTAEHVAAHEQVLRQRAKMEAEMAKRAEREKERLARDAAQEAKRLEAAKKKEEAAEKAKEREKLSKMRYEAYRETWPESVVDVGRSANADKYESAIESMKVKRALKTGPDQLHLMGALALQGYDTMVNDYGVNPLRHRTRGGGTTLPAFWMRAEVKEELRPVWQEVIAEYPGWFVDSPVWFRALMSVYSVVDRFSVTVMMAEVMQAKREQQARFQAPPVPTPEQDPLKKGMRRQASGNRGVVPPGFSGQAPDEGPMVDVDYDDL